MKKLLPFLSLVVLLMASSQTYAIDIWESKIGCWLVWWCASWVSTTLASTTDEQLLNLDNSWTTQELSANFELKKFSSCENFENVVKKYIQDYSRLYPNRWFWYDIMLQDDMALPNGAVEKSISDSAVWNSSSVTPEAQAANFSETNIQVTWVDESEIIKTDGKNIYFYNELTHSIYIAKAFPAKDLQILKVIKVPASFNSPELYINWTKLIIIANKYFQWNYSYYWFARQQKTVFVSYDISDLNNLKVEKYYQVDWTVTKSRRIGKYVYILSQSNFSFPYNTYAPMIKSWVSSLDTQKLNADFDAKKILPKKAELRLTNNVSEQNVNIHGSPAPYNLSQWYTSQCSDIEYVMPDEATLAKFNFTPSYTTLSIINTEDPSETVKTKLLFGDVNEVYMSLDNLYITSNLYTSYNFTCPVIQCIKAPCPQLPCSMPYYNAWENTLIHKIALNGNQATYKASTIIPGSPLNQYSMDQASDWTFRIITTSYSPSHSTNVFVLDKNLKVSGKLTWLAKDENFQSSRFIWNKLYLVTFQQIDPLFVIDLSDNTNPKVLWELKIPGYSTYLHPYDETHLIWLGYATQDSWHGWIMNGWLKIDLYDVSDIKNPKQQYTLTIWAQGSTSDTLSNPRLFTWNAKEKLLFMPATLYKSANDANNPYRHSDAFQWSMAIKIDKDSWIKEIAEVTHINTPNLEKARLEECAKYTSVEPPKCEKLINGKEYCPPVSTYVPTYCYASSSAWEYFANQIWNYNNEFVIRNLYLDNLWYTISNTKIQVNDIADSFKKIDEVSMK